MKPNLHLHLIILHEENDFRHTSEGVGGAYNYALIVLSESLYDWSLSGGTPRWRHPNPFVPFGIYQEIATANQINEWLRSDDKNNKRTYGIEHYGEITKEGINVLYELLRRHGIKVNKKLFDNANFAIDVIPRLNKPKQVYYDINLVVERSLVDIETIFNQKINKKS